MLPGSKFEWGIQVLPRGLKTAVIDKLGDKALLGAWPAGVGVGAFVALDG